MKKRIFIVFMIVMCLGGCVSAHEEQEKKEIINVEDWLDKIPVYTGEPYVVLNENVPLFSEKEKEGAAYEYYSELDDLGRCGYVQAKIGIELMPTEERGPIGMVKPSGWHLVKYDHIEDNYLYNRCHLIGYQLTGENANEKNLITGTRYLNIEGMLPFENLVADYIQNTGNHVIYRVTPIFKEENLLADGVQMEAVSIEDDGAGICFNVFVYNVQPGVEIDYATGENRLTEPLREFPNEEKEELSYVLNTNTGKFHYETCDSVNDMKEKNKEMFYGSRDEIIGMGYEPCGRCYP